MPVVKLIEIGGAGLSRIADLVGIGLARLVTGQRREIEIDEAFGMIEGIEGGGIGGCPAVILNGAGIRPHPVDPPAEQGGPFGGPFGLPFGKGAEAVAGGVVELIRTVRPHHHPHDRGPPILDFIVMELVADPDRVAGVQGQLGFDRIAHVGGLGVHFHGAGAHRRLIGGIIKVVHLVLDALPIDFGVERAPIEFALIAAIGVVGLVVVHVHRGIGKPLIGNPVLPGL